MRVWRGRGAPSRAAISTGFSALDEALPGGGWPVGAITEVLVNGYGIGELTLLMPALRALTQKKAPGLPQKWVAWISPPFVPYAPALERHGVALERLLMIHPTSGDRSRLWAIEQVIRSGGSCGVLAWITTADDTILRRMQLAAEDRECWVVLFRPQKARQQRSPAALRIMLSQQDGKIQVQIIKCRGSRPSVVVIERLVDEAARGSSTKEFA